MLPFSLVNELLVHRARRISEINVSGHPPHLGNEDKEAQREAATCPRSEPITWFQSWCPNYYHVLRNPFISTKTGLLTESNLRPREVFGEGTHESLGFLSPVFGKVKTTAGTNPRFMPVGVDIATRRILALSPAS